MGGRSTLDRCRVRRALRPTTVAPPFKLLCSAFHVAPRSLATGRRPIGRRRRHSFARSGLGLGLGSSMQWRWPRRAPAPRQFQQEAKCQERGRRCFAASACRSAVVHRGRVRGPDQEEARPASRFDSRVRCEANRWIRFHVKQVALALHSVVPRGTPPVRQATGVARQPGLS